MSLPPARKTNRSRDTVTCTRVEGSDINRWSLNYCAVVRTRHRLWTLLLKVFNFICFDRRRSCFVRCLCPFDSLFLSVVTKIFLCDRFTARVFMIHRCCLRASDMWFYHVTLWRNFVLDWTPGRTRTWAGTRCSPTSTDVQTRYHGPIYQTEPLLGC